MTFKEKSEIDILKEQLAYYTNRGEIFCSSCGVPKRLYHILYDCDLEWDTSDDGIYSYCHCCYQRRLHKTEIEELKSELEELKSELEELKEQKSNLKQKLSCVRVQLTRNGFAMFIKEIINIMKFGD